MNKLIILFPSSHLLEVPYDAFEDEYKAALTHDEFEVVLFGFNDAVNSGKLKLSREVPNKRCPAIFRGPRLSVDKYALLMKAAKDAGITLITDDWHYKDMHWFGFDDFRVLGESRRNTPETRRIDKSSSYTAYGGMRSKIFSTTGEPYLPAANDTGENLIIKDLDRDERVIGVADKMTYELFKQIRARYPISERWGLYSNLIVQERVYLKRHSDKTNEWRGWYFDGALFELCPNSGQPPSAAQPPRWLIDKYRSESPFFTLDFAELSDGDWMIIGSDDGQVSKLAKEQSAEGLYRSLAEAVSDSPHLPEWIWCLVANIDDDATWTAPDGSVLKGTKHFRPGAKIYIGREWHGYYGDWTFVVMGKPRRQNRLIQVYMPHKRLCNFRLKKVYDKRVIERMTRGDRGCPVLGGSKNAHGGWDSSDESRRKIEEWVKILSKEYSERHLEKGEGR